MNKPTSTAATQKIVFTMGLPGAGKSTTANAQYPGAFWLDPDAIKESHKDYDPKNPAALHAWSQEVIADMWADVVEGKNDSAIIIVDGTGTNAEKMTTRIAEAKEAGFTAELFLCSVTLETAKARNASRARVVPTHIIEEKAQTLNASFEICSRVVDSVVVIKND